jgi:type I site-specific restriction endonuclease
MKPEDRARRKIDPSLEAAGWQVQDLCSLNLGVARRCANSPLNSGTPDYLLFVDRLSVDVVEAKPPRTTFMEYASLASANRRWIPRMRSSSSCHAQRWSIA